jgi:tetratricopeptide (TPR) repeat protein
MDRGEYEKAAVLLRQALATDPENLGLRYRLGVSASHLNRKDEAIREFRWVMERAPANAPEAEIARGWLLRSGVPLQSRQATTAAPESSPPSEQGLGELTGRVAWEEDGNIKPLVRQQLFLKGVAGPAGEKEAYHITRSDGQGMYKFTGLLPGSYMLTNRVAGAPIWRLKVVVEPGQRLALDLTAQNSVKTRDDFPKNR